VRDIKLKVGELTQREDFGRGLARLDARKMDEIGAKEGEIIEVEGKRKAAVVAARSYPADVGLDIIRIDGLMRRNSKADIGGFITVRKARVKRAKKVVLAPVDRGFMIRISPNLLKQMLFMRPLAKDDILISSPAFKSDNIFESFFGLEEVFFPVGAEAKLKVIGTIPKNFVQVDEKTEIEIKSEVAKDEIVIKQSRIPRAITFKKGKSIQEFKRFSKGLTREEVEKILEEGSRKDFFCYKERDGLWYLFKKVTSGNTKS
jgi:hypothetical protein